jgi:hypothetical protein
MKINHCQFLLLLSGRYITKLIQLILIPLICGCTSTYHSMSLGLLEYSKADTVNNISYSFHFHTLSDFSNKKYEQKGIQNNIRLVAFNFENLSSRRINLANDLEYFEDHTKIIYPKEPNSIYNSFALSPKKYLWYLPLVMVNAYWFESYRAGVYNNSHLRIIPIGIFIGPMLTLFNFSAVKKANINFGKDLDKYSPFTSIEPGEKKYVLIPFENISEQPIRIRLKNTYK